MFEEVHRRLDFLLGWTQRKRFQTETLGWQIDDAVGVVTRFVEQSTVGRKDWRGDNSLKCRNGGIGVGNKVSSKVFRRPNAHSLDYFFTANLPFTFHDPI